MEFLLKEGMEDDSMGTSSGKISAEIMGTAFGGEREMMAWENQCLSSEQPYIIIKVRKRERIPGIRISRIEYSGKRG